MKEFFSTKLSSQGNKLESVELRSSFRSSKAILCFTMQLFETSNASLVWIFVIFQYFLIITALLLEYFVDDVPEDVTIQLQRTEFIVKAITEGLGNSNAPTVNPGVIDGQALSLPQLHDEDEE